MLDRLYQIGTNQMARTIATRLAALPRGRRNPSVPSEVMAQAHAGALVALLRWWLDQDGPRTPEQIGTLDHAIVSAP